MGYLTRGLCGWLECCLKVVLKHSDLQIGTVKGSIDLFQTLLGICYAPLWGKGGGEDERQRFTLG